MIQGGWEYVRAAYIVTWIVLSGYGLSVWKRSSNLRKREKRL